MSKNGDTARLFFQYSDKKDGFGIRDKQVPLGQCHKNEKNGMWVGHHKAGYPVYFVTPLPIGFGMATGHYLRKYAPLP